MEELKITVLLKKFNYNEIVIEESESKDDLFWYKCAKFCNACKFVYHLFKCWWKLYINL